VTRDGVGGTVEGRVGGGGEARVCGCETGGVLGGEGRGFDNGLCAVGIGMPPTGLGGADAAGRSARVGGTPGRGEGAVPPAGGRLFPGALPEDGNRFPAVLPLLGAVAELPARLNALPPHFEHTGGGIPLTGSSSFPHALHLYFAITQSFTRSCQRRETRAFVRALPFSRKTTQPPTAVTSIPRSELVCRDES